MEIKQILIGEREQDQHVALELTLMHFPEVAPPLGQEPEMV